MNINSNIEEVSKLIVTVNGIVQDLNKDFVFENGKLIFKVAPEPNAKILIKKLEENGKTNN